ncbi:LacI family DNA-binding transcriptional regulator [Sphingomonas montana]|uniref:LacI family DNA-binding transcriptional regulator n=1 Tax=Sphingomonas montana TaxID=1843236 RepID=UPI00096E6207|nr:LacI family DNA-binding transcriptional regulator [Sphingomonas montana]
MRITIRDVSEAAGVSFKTVSRVLNKERHVRPATRERVEAAMKALNFRPSYAARALAGARSFQIALIYDNPSPYYVHTIQMGVRARCMEDRIRMIVQPCDLASPGLAAEIGGLVDETHVDGVILAPPLGDIAAVTAELERRGVPYVRITPGDPTVAEARVTMDDAGAAARMTRHLIDLGHVRIGFVTGPAGHVSAQRRLEGYRSALAEAGIAAEAGLMAAGGFDFETGEAAAGALLDAAAPPTAIFASNDDMAAGALAAAHARGIAVPDALSIAGFDDIDLARAVWPPLTTIRQPIHALAYAAADMLLDTDGSGGAGAVPDYELVVRGSTGVRRAE